MKLNCIIIDDEPLAIRLLKGFVERTPFLELRATFLNPMEALTAITSDIHLVFLDINMPGITGLELSKFIHQPTRIIFTTAYKEFAFESYEVQALDYLLKPVSYTKFLHAANRGLAHFEQLAASSAPAQVPQKATEEEPDYIFVKCEFKQVRIDLDNILFVSGMRDYVRIHLKGQKLPITALSTMKAMEEKLKEPRFMRVHRSYIVAMDKIESVERNCISINGEVIPVSAVNLDHFYEMLK